MGASDSSSLPDLPTTESGVTSSRGPRQFQTDGSTYDQPLAMIDHDRLAVKKVVTHGCNLPGSDTFNGCSFWSRNIKPAVGAPSVCR